MTQNRYVTNAIRERSRFALTADVWEELGRTIGSYPPACIKENPKYREVLHVAWALHKKDALAFAADPFITMSLIMIGLVGRRLCVCFPCNFNFEDGEIR